MIRTLFAIASLVLLAAPEALAQPRTAPAATTATPPVQQIRASKIILVGDSTMQVGSGWGGAFCSHHVNSFVACVDLGRGGRSSMSYRAEGSWRLALSEMSARGFQATYVLIQFGHNDQPGKPGRSTDLATEFPVNTRRYVTETRAYGAIPVLVTPLTRRQFVNGQLQNDLEPWSEAVRQVAAEMHVPLLDLNADSAAAVQALGPSQSARFAQAPPSQEVATALLTGTTIAAATGVPQAPTPAPSANAPFNPTGPRSADTAALETAVTPVAQQRIAFDYTHLGPEGADFFASMVTRELIAAVPELRRNLQP